MTRSFEAPSTSSTSSMFNNPGSNKPATDIKKSSNPFGDDDPSF